MKKISPALLILAASSFVNADIAYDNFGPGSTFTGNGFLVMGPQGGMWTHAFPITPSLSGEITTVTVAIQHLSGGTNTYTLELRADAAGSPGALIAVLGQVAGIGGGPVPAQFAANAGIAITAGTPYWVYARGQGDAVGTWLGSPTLGGIRAFSFDGGSSFTVEPLFPSAGQGALRIEVASSGGGCYPNCDGSTVPPILTANDFTCFLTSFVAVESYANCDGSTVEPVLTANDFTCFLTSFVAGCS
jgi:hypothetical protein